MYKKYKFPIQLFLIFENLSLYYWTSTVVKPNHSITFWPAKTSLLLAKVLKSELILTNSFLVENSSIDTSLYSSNTLNFDALLKTYKNLVFYIFYFYSISYKLTICFPVNTQILSIEAIYPNASWVERETIEMYGLNMYNKLDSRNLLLDYTTLDNPLLKSYPCPGITEVFYNPLEDCVMYYPTTSVEL
jgi:NADH:ubiquinone oxidoreductase subunit C